MANRANQAIAEVCEGAAKLAGVVMEVEVDAGMDERYEAAAREMAGLVTGALMTAIGHPNDTYRRLCVRAHVDRCPPTLNQILVVCDETNNDRDLVDQRAIRVKVFMDGGNVAGDKLSVLMPPHHTWFEVTMRPPPPIVRLENAGNRDDPG